MNRIYAAIEQICSGNYCVKSLYYSDNPLSKNVTEYIFWKYGDVCVTDSQVYESGNLGRGHPIRREDPEYEKYDCSLNPHFFNGWARALPWDQPNYRIYFSQGDSLISEEEISFTGAFFSNYSSLHHFSVFFDETGALQSIERKYQNYLGRTSTSVLSIERVPEEEIRAVVEEALAKEAEQEDTKMGNTYSDPPFSELPAG